MHLLVRLIILDQESTRKVIFLIYVPAGSEITDITGPIPEKLPPLREVNRRILLINTNNSIKHRYSKCPDSLRPRLMEKIERYAAAG